MSTSKVSNNHISDMTVGNPTKDILWFALPLILGYIL